MQAVPTISPQSNIRIKKRPVPRPLKRVCYRLHLIIISFPGMWPRQRLYVIAVTPLCRILCFLSPIRLLHCESHGLGLAHVFLVEFRMVGGKCPCIKLIADNSLESNHPVTHLCFLLMSSCRSSICFSMAFFWASRTLRSLTFLSNVLSDIVCSPSLQPLPVLRVYCLWLTGTTGKFVGIVCPGCFCFLFLAMYIVYIY